MISKNEGEKYKEKFELDYFIETSAKTGMNAQEIFIEAAKILYNDYTFYKKEKKNKVKDNKENILLLFIYYIINETIKFCVLKD